MMQLFTIGTNMLNQDGTRTARRQQSPHPHLSATHHRRVCQVYTGWTYAPAPGGQVNWNSYISSYGPMVPYPPEHDSTSKQLLNGYVSPAGLLRSRI